MQTFDFNKHTLTKHYIKMKAKLRNGEDLSINGYTGEVTSDMLWDFEYDARDRFFIIINGIAHEESSTAFDFIQE